VEQLTVRKAAIEERAAWKAVVLGSRVGGLTARGQAASPLPCRLRLIRSLFWALLALVRRPWPAGDLPPGGLPSRCLPLWGVPT
jgi:hypothetical protein